LKQLAEQIAAKHELTVDDGSKTVKLKRPDTKEEQILIRELAAFARRQGAETDNATRYRSISALQIETYKVIRALLKKGYEEEANLLLADAKLVATNMTRENCFKFSIFASRIGVRLINAKLEYSKTTNLGLHKIKIERSTQYRETDLEYLKRIAAEYGFAFSIKGKVMVFYNIKALEESQAVTKLSKSNIRSYSLKDKTSETFKGATVKSHNSSKKEVVIVDVQSEPQSAENGDTYNEITKEDTIEIRLRSENKQQAEAKAKAALHKKNSRVQEGSLSLEGNPLLLAGNNFELSEMGKLSGKWHIEESTHTITKSGGYTTDIEVKRIARFSGDGSATKVAAGKNTGKRGDTTGEENYLKVLAAEAYETGKIETNDERYPRVDAVLANANKIVTLLYQKNCEREAKQLQSNILMLQTFKSRENAFRFSGNCQKIRIELIRARK
jgi:phage protein D